MLGRSVTHVGSPFCTISAVEFLERDEELRALERALAAVSKSRGRVVAVCGEAGIGKTRLVHEFLQGAADGARILWGACDDLLTPRALGPFRDIARTLGIETEFAAAGATAEMYGALLEALDAGVRPTVVVVEDAHWADAASLDVLKYVGRRVERTRVMLLVTYRDDEVTADHPLRFALGQIPADVLTRLPLQPLSKAAVARLTENHLKSAEEVYALTRGNPFLVTEVLANAGDEIPDNVLDSLAARISHLDDETRSVVELVAVVPGRCERAIVEAHLPGPGAILAGCRERGLLDFDDQTVWFRHELARRAVEGAIAPRYLRMLHHQVMDVLIARGADPARIVHHAEQAGEVEALLRFGPEAARQAVAVAAHREAVSHYRQVLPHLEHLPAADRAGILAEYSVESHYVEAQREALEAVERAVALYRQLGDDRRVGDQLRWESRVRWWLTDREGAYRAAREAVAILEQLPEGPELAMAYSGLAHLHMLSHQVEETTTWATRAIDTARRVGAPAVLSHALNNLGSVRCRAGDLEGRQLLIESYQIARREGLDDDAGRAMSNHVWILIEHRLYADAEPLLDEGIAFSREREIEGNLNYMTSERAWLRFDRGEWDAAEADVRWVLARPQEPGITTLPALITLARVQVRKGDPAAEKTLNEAWEMARRTGELQRMSPAASARAEHAWLRGDRDGIRDAILPAWALIDASAPPLVGDELAFWLHRAGLLEHAPAGIAVPFARWIEGDWQGAAAEWHRLGCPYEEAIALADSGAETHLLHALEILDGLGAIPAAALVRRTLRTMGVAGVPRGPRPTTRANPGGLTGRQLGVLELVAAGLTNAEIADRLFISTKTVDHHVSAILVKLGATTRHEAAEKLRAWDPEGSPS
jgi:DNA-binding CsgD family transcriptional regulator/type II secretory pathway predicted ATPase ExeA/tetratricopeptide (TPR) repeat protein